MEHTKSNFRALREIVGISQQHLADELGVTVMSVKRWEKPDYNEPPQDAWDVLEDARERQKWTVTEIIERVHADGERGVGRVSLTYWRNAADFAAAHGGDGSSWQMANASARLVAHLLEADGYDIEFGFGSVNAVGGDVDFEGL